MSTADNGTTEAESVSSKNRFGNLSEESVGVNVSPVTVRHGSSRNPVTRRHFLGRSGRCIAGGVVLAAGAGQALAADCDQNPAQNTRCSDSDSGDNADPQNCGRCGRESTVPS